jgi:hypothetical protein
MVILVVLVNQIMLHIELAAVVAALALPDLTDLYQLVLDKALVVA